MENQKVELDVDFIGGQEPLTKEEEVALKAYFQSRRLTRRSPFRMHYKKKSENAVLV
jgi:hypothetical protein